MPPEVAHQSIDRFPHLKQLMRRFVTRHRIDIGGELETELDQSKASKGRRSITAGYRTGTAMFNENTPDEYRNRMERYDDYEKMQEDASVSGGLDIYADEATQTNAVTGHMLEITSDEQAVREELEKLFFKDLRIDEQGWGMIRRLCQMGDDPYEIRYRKDFRGVYGIQRIDPKRFERIEDQGKLLGFRVLGKPDWKRRRATRQYVKQLRAKDKIVNPFRIVHFRLPSASMSIYGRAILEAARRTWRQVRLMEDSVVIYRLSRGAERRVFYIQTGTLADDETEGYIKNLMAKFRKRPFINPRTGEIDEKANPLAWDEDFYIPIQDNRDNTRIEQLPGGANMGEIEDLQYFRNKIDAELKIPTTYLNREGNYDTKAGLSQQDIRFSRTIERVQRSFVEGLTKVAYIHLMLKGFTYRQITGFTIKMIPPSALAELLRLDALSMKLEIASQAKGTEMLPDVWIMTEIMMFSADEANELIQIMSQQRQAAAQAEASAAGGGMGGGPVGGMGGGEMGGPVGVEGGMPPEGQEGIPAGPGEAGAQPPAPGGPGTPEMAHVLPGPVPVISEDYKTALKSWLSRKAREQKRVEVRANFGNFVRTNEVGGLKIKFGEELLTESSLETLGRVDTVIETLERKQRDVSPLIENL